MASMLEGQLDCEEFTCSWCKNLLSIPPILSVNEEVFCGRCKDKVKKYSDRDIEKHLLYEDLAKKCRFPCRYEDDGCEKLLKWENVQEHEENCGFGKIECLLNWEEFKEGNGCEWNGYRYDFCKHYHEKHASGEHIIDRREIWEQPKSQLFELYISRETFLLILLFIDNIYYLMVCRKNKHPMTYGIEILSDTRTYSVIYSNLTKYVPYNISKIQENGITLKFMDINPKYLTVSFGDISGSSIAKCDAKFLPHCVRCLLPLSSSAFTCISSHYIECESCSSGTACKHRLIGKLCDKLLTNHYPTTDCEGQFKCKNGNCLFYGNFFETILHEETCSCYEIPMRNINIAPLNHFLQKGPILVYFIFDKKIFILHWKEETKTYTIFSTLRSEKKYKFEITVKYPLSEACEILKLETPFHRHIKNGYFYGASRKLSKYLPDSSHKFKLIVSTY